jgi:hypothetical protein
MSSLKKYDWINSNKVISPLVVGFKQIQSCVRGTENGNSSPLPGADADEMVGNPRFDNDPHARA